MPELPELVQSLLDPAVYPEPADRVELIQTQISYVFLVGEYVYKTKKPVDMGFLDYSTLDKRLACCRKEVDLNRRLCSEAYLGVVPVTRDGGRIRIDGKGEVEEYAVKMLRLPESAMMNVLLGENKVTLKMIDDVAEKMADFHRKAATGGEIDKYGSIEAVSLNVMENFEQTEKYFDVIIRPETHRNIKQYAEGFFKDRASLFRKRVEEGRIRDCHGDLHAAHICFWKGICIYDCIEFIDRLRYSDVAAEIAFLSMDLDHYGRPDLSNAFVKAYVEKSGDNGLLELLNFYKSYRAYVRGKVNCFQYDDPYIPAAEKEKIIGTARGYFELSESYIKDG